MKVKRKGRFKVDQWGNIIHDTGDPKKAYGYPTEHHIARLLNAGERAKADVKRLRGAIAALINCKDPHCPCVDCMREDAT